MTILLDHIPSASNPSARPLRTHRQHANSSCHASYPPCGSPPRFRERSPPQSRPLKAARSVSPGGTPASSPCLRRPSDVNPKARTPSPGRVRWATTLEQSVVTRPKTSREDIPKLFYSRADQRRFRREAELDDHSLNDEETSSASPKKDYSISKAVIVFGETTKTYDSSIWSFPTTNCAIEASNEKDFSFDDPAFWNGILTWS